MIRKVLIPAAIALAAFGVTSATSAHAADEFHCAISPCTLTLKPDGFAGSTTAHHVFVVKGETHAGQKRSGRLAFTCKQITGDKTLTGNTATEITFQNLVYDECEVAGERSYRHNEQLRLQVHSSKWHTDANGQSGAPRMHHPLEMELNYDIERQLPCIKVTPMTTISGGFIKYHDCWYE